MLNNAFVHPTIAVTDLKRAKEFYGKRLGLRELPGTMGDGDAVFQCGGGTELYLYERPKPAGSTATVCSFQVDDVESNVRDLRSKGVKFEEYDMPDMGIKTVNGVATMGDVKAAWFKDPDGNILAIGNNPKIKVGTPQAQRA